MMPLVWWKQLTQDYIPLILRGEIASELFVFSWCTFNVEIFRLCVRFLHLESRSKGKINCGLLENTKRRQILGCFYKCWEEQTGLWRIFLTPKGSSCHTEIFFQRCLFPHSVNWLRRQALPSPLTDRKDSRRDSCFINTNGQKLGLKRRDTEIHKLQREKIRLIYLLLLPRFAWDGYSLRAASVVSVNKKRFVEVLLFFCLFEFKLIFSTCVAQYMFLTRCCQE